MSTMILLNPTAPDWLASTNFRIQLFSWARLSNPTGAFSLASSSRLANLGGNVADSFVYVVNHKVRIGFYQERIQKRES